MPTAPSSKMPSILPPKSSKTWEASVGLGRPERFAEGPAMGKPQARIKARVKAFSGERRATVSSPPVLSLGTMSDFGSTRVKGPGQKASISFFAFSGKAFTKG